ncbi:Lrp/AsnC ligand binding domain-containing protein [Paenibacillus sp. Marseille-Q7038]
MESYPTVLFCYRIAGRACYMVMLTLSRLDEIETFIDEISAYTSTLTHVVFSEVKINTALEQHTSLLP